MYKNKEIISFLIIYLFVTIHFETQYPNLYNSINAIFWGIVLIFMLVKSKKDYIRPCKNRKYFICLIILSCVYIIIFFYTGFFLGFTKSPYKHDALSIVKNIILQIVPIIGIEVTRGIVAIENKKDKLALITITIVLLLIEIKYNVIVELYSNKEEIFKYICSTIIPTISYSILCTYLSLKGSYTLPLIYRISKELPILLLPILPDLNWFITGAIGILSPAIVYGLFKYKFIKEKKDIRKKQETIFSKISFVLAVILSITLICFMMGFFKYEPITILSNSMFPTFSRGDVLIFKKLNEDELKKISENTIIIYTKEEQNIAHRVINRKKEKGTVLYQTKGDNNNVPDTNWVKIEEIKGAYTFHIKYIGFPSVWLYSYFNQEGR